MTENLMGINKCKTKGRFFRSLRADTYTCFGLDLPCPTRFEVAVNVGDDIRVLQ